MKKEFNVAKSKITVMTNLNNTLQTKIETANNTLEKIKKQKIIVAREYINELKEKVDVLELKLQKNTKDKHNLKEENFMLKQMLENLENTQKTKVIIGVFSQKKTVHIFQGTHSWRAKNVESGSVELNKEKKV